MDCADVQNRLVAWHDGELGASEASLVERHLAACRRCAATERRLRETTPLPPALAVPRPVLERLERATARDRLEILSATPRALPPVPTGHIRVSAGALVALVFLAGIVGFGLSSWVSTDSGGTRGAPSMAGAGKVAIPAAQFHEASYELPEGAPQDVTEPPPER